MATDAIPGSSASRLTAKKKRRWGEELIQVVLFLCALLSVGTTLSIIWILIQEVWAFFREISPWAFLLGMRWAPLVEPRSYGVLPLVCGTLLVVIGAALISIPLGLASGIYLSEYASARVRGLLKPILEILAGVPTVVYGYFALTFITPLLARIIPSTQVFNATSAAIVVGIMVLPMIASMCDDSFRAVPRSLRDAGFAMGATHFEVTTEIILPGALSGVLASFVLALSRAIGETMAVTLAAGATPKLTLNPMESIQTMTAYIVQVSLGDTPTGSLEYRTIFAVGLLLFLITLSMNLLAHRVLRRFREVYE